MGTNGLRERTKARTREEIALAALHLFETHGYDATTTQEIAAEAGVSARTFFRYFDTKADVLFAGRSERTGPRAALTELAQRPQGEAPVESLRHALRHPVEELEKHRELVVRQFDLLMTTPSLGELRRESFHRFEGPFAEVFAARLGVTATDLAPQLLAALAASTLRISIERWVVTGAKAGALLPLLEESLDHVQRGFASDPSSA